MEITVGNKNRIAIVVVGYNKLKGLQRLLNALNEAYYEIDNVPLIISIDASGNELVYDCARTFEWKHGSKFVNIQQERLGLKNHIFQCASLCKHFKGVVVLEDDLMVSPNFYHYCIASLDKYGDEEKIAGIALYLNETNGFAGLPFYPFINESDVFAWQSVCSWGEMWNERMWNGFVSWLEQWDGNFETIDMYDRIKEWPRAWSKYFYAYLIQTNRFFIFPYQSLTTNFNDAGGEHGGGNANIVQVSLMHGARNYQLSEFEQLVKYDVYGQNIDLPNMLNIKPEDITIDFYGLKAKYKGMYVLAPFDLPFKKIKGFALSMRPWEMNIKYNIEGNDVYLYRRESDCPICAPKRSFNLNVAYYYLRGFNFKLLIKYVCDGLIKRILSKLHLYG